MNLSTNESLGIQELDQREALTKRGDIHICRVTKGGSRVALCNKKYLCLCHSSLFHCIWVERQPDRGQADQCSIIYCLGWRAANENHLSSEGSNAHPVVIEDITVVYSRYRGVHFSSETVMMLLRQLSHAIKTR